MKWSSTHSSWLAAKLALCSAALGLLLSVGAFGADTTPDSGPIDWDRARAIHQREQSGEKLSADDQAYLDRAKAAMQAGEGPNKQAGGARLSDADRQRARELFQKKQNGETLSADDQAFLDKVKASMQRRAGAQTQPTGDQRVGDIDMQKARQLYEKSQQGATLTSEEQAYLD